MRIVGTVLLFLSLAIFDYPSVILAQAQDGRPDLMGVISTSRQDDTRTPYTKAQDESIAYFKSLQSAVANPGALSKQPPLDPSWMNYLTASYLYCSVNNGACPFILQSILEAEVINSKIDGTASCPSMLGFWKAWVAADMENRHKYMVKTAYLNMTDEFRRLQRPKFLECKKTITALIQGAPSPSAFFQSRYRSESEALQSISQTVKLLEEIQRTVGNVIVAVGASDGAATAEGSKDAAKKDTKSTARKVKK